MLKGLWFGGGFGDHLLEVGLLAATFVVFTGVDMKTFKWE